MSDETKIKVTDRRMFTPTGELREEYRESVDESGSTSRDSRSAPPSAPSAPPTAAGIVGPDAGLPSTEGGAAGSRAQAPAGAPTSPPPSAGGPPAAASSPPEETDDDEEGESKYPSGAQFEDLIGLLAQGASVYLQQAQQPENRSEHLELARLHVDLLAILKETTVGNISARHKALLDDAIYQLRMAVVQYG